METIRDDEEEKKSCEGINIVFIGHPIRQTQEFIIDNEKYRISFDGFKDENQNEDPFIWNENFLYSFCHANHALSKEIRQKINGKNRKKEEVYFVFVAKTAKDSDIFEIDTIIKAKEIYCWPNKNNRFKKNLCKQIFNDEVITKHLPKFLDEGGLSQHNNKDLYTCVGDREGSFLPMVKDKNEDIFIPYKFDDDDDSKKLLELIQVKNSKRYYVVQENSPRLSKNNLKDDFKSISKKVIDLIKVEYENTNKLTYDKRFLKAEQICDLDSDYR